MINVRELEKKYGNQSILNSVNFTINEGNLNIFIGINGSGKSSILKILGKTIYKTSGQIDVKGDIAYLPDKYSFPKLMTTKNYLKNILKLYSLKEEYLKLLTEFDIPNKLIGSLSKGNLQKLGLLQILIIPADIYLFDEPLDGLDDFAKKLFKSKIKEKLEQNKTIIMSLHTKTIFNEFKPIIYEIKDGKVYEKKKKN